MTRAPGSQDGETNVGRIHAGCSEERLRAPRRFILVANETRSARAGPSRGPLRLAVRRCARATNDHYGAARHDSAGRVAILSRRMLAWQGKGSWSRPVCRPTTCGAFRPRRGASRRSATRAPSRRRTTRDPFLPLAIAAEHTTRLGLGTSVAIAFPRAPMVVAQVAWDLQRFSKGRFVARPRQSGPQAQRGALLGALDRAGGAHARVHPDAARDLGLVAARQQAVVRRRALPLHVHDAVLQSGADRASAHSGGDLGRQSRHVPPRGRGVRRRAPAQLLHAQVSRRGHPAQHRARRGEGGPLARATSSCRAAGSSPPGRDDEAVRKQFENIRRQVSFYGSTPSYFGVLEAHGWGALGERLNKLSRDGKWQEMAAAVPDEVVHAFATVGRYDEIVSAHPRALPRRAPHRARAAGRGTARRGAGARAARAS